MLHPAIVASNDESKMAVQITEQHPACLPWKDGGLRRGRGVEWGTFVHYSA